MIRVIWRQGGKGPLPREFQGLESGENNIERIEKCVCGEQRVVWENDKTDYWKNHFDYCEAVDWDGE